MAMFKRRTKARRLRDLRELEPLLEGARPILIDFFQVGCAPCQVMDGIIDELAREYGDSAHVVKVDVRRVPGAADAFKVRSTPTMVLLAPPPPKKAKAGKKRKKGTIRAPGAAGGRRRVTQRWRASGLVRKDQLARVLESNGARRADV